MESKKLNRLLADVAANLQLIAMVQAKELQAIRKSLDRIERLDRKQERSFDEDEI